MLIRCWKGTSLTQTVLFAVYYVTVDLIGSAVRVLEKWKGRKNYGSSQVHAYGQTRPLGLSWRTWPWLVSPLILSIVSSFDFDSFRGFHVARGKKWSLPIEDEYYSLHCVVALLRLYVMSVANLSIHNSAFGSGFCHICFIWRGKLSSISNGLEKLA